MIDNDCYKISLLSPDGATAN